MRKNKKKYFPCLKILVRQFLFINTNVKFVPQTLFDLLLLRTFSHLTPHKSDVIYECFTSQCRGYFNFFINFPIAKILSNHEQPHSLLQTPLELRGLLSTSAQWLLTNVKKGLNVKTLQKLCTISAVLNLDFFYFSRKLMC